MNVFIKNQAVKLGKPFAEGGEAEIYKIDGGANVVKLFKTADHPSYSQDPMQQQGAIMRSQEYQLKLKSFPPNVPQKVVAPQHLVYDQKGMVIGYVMPFVDKTFPLIRYSDKMFREQSGVDEQQIMSIFHQLQNHIIALHQNQIVIGDLNDLNILVKGTDVYMIDTDSYQFGKFMSHTFTQTFLDPMIAKEHNGQLWMNKPYEATSDWYAYAVMLMQALIYVGPYGGIYAPKDPQKKVSGGLRPLRRITLFDPEVKYPKAAIPYKYLPDELLQWFWNVFTKDLRQPLPEHIFTDIQWSTCPKCQTRHAKKRCPVCDLVVPGLSKPLVKVDGSLRVTQILKTPGIVLMVKTQHNKLLWLIHEQGTYTRENKAVIAHGTLNPTTRYALQNNATLIAKSSQLVAYEGAKTIASMYTETYENIPVFAANGSHYYWVQSGELMKNGAFGAERIASVLSEKTFIWVGESFGFGISREAMFQLPFVFGVDSKGILEVKDFPKLPGRIIDAATTFTNELCWYFYKMEYRGTITTGCVVINRQGIVVANVVPDQTEAWIQNIHGKSAFGNYLFSATDEGIVRLTLDQGMIINPKLFTATENLVDATSRLLVADGGIYVVNLHAISHITFT